jgi:hypothetical protein
MTLRSIEPASQQYPPGEFRWPLWLLMERIDEVLAAVRAVGMERDRVSFRDPRHKWALMELETDPFVTVVWNCDQVLKPDRLPDPCRQYFWMTPKSFVKKPSGWWSGLRLIHRRLGVANLTDSSPLQERYAVRRGAKPTDPVQDPKASLSELMRDLRRATAASYSPRSFAPPARQMLTSGSPATTGVCGKKRTQERSVATREVLEIPAIA